MSTTALSTTVTSNIKFTTNATYNLNQFNCVASITNSTNQTLSGSSNNAVALGTVAIPSSGTSLTVGTNSITVNDAGTYNVTFNCTMTPTVAGIHVISLYNGATILAQLNQELATVNTPYLFEYNQFVSLAANSVITVQALQPSGAAVISGIAPQKAFLSINRIN